jgi:hypothetical protein
LKGLHLSLNNGNNNNNKSLPSSTIQRYRAAIVHVLHNSSTTLEHVRVTIDDERWDGYGNGYGITQAQAQELFSLSVIHRLALYIGHCIIIATSHPFTEHVTNTIENRFCYT